MAWDGFAGAVHEGGALEEIGEHEAEHHIFAEETHRFAADEGGQRGDDEQGQHPDGDGEGADAVIGADLLFAAGEEAVHEPGVAVEDHRPEPDCDGEHEEGELACEHVDDVAVIAFELGEGFVNVLRQQLRQGFGLAAVIERDEGDDGAADEGEAQDDGADGEPGLLTAGGSPQEAVFGDIPGGQAHEEQEHGHERQAGDDGDGDGGDAHGQRQFGEARAEADIEEGQRRQEEENKAEADAEDDEE